ncbi:MAG TPA: hypothetical protein VKA46_29465 [Gemmataceae bacterium]|nr:hypothetical protein [Gemmataceae bacterium]
MLHLIAVASAVGAILGAWPFVTQGEHTAGYAIGGVLLVVAALVEVVASALRKRKKWAWTAAIAVFVLGLPGVAAVIGLFLLLNRDVRAEFEPAPTGGAEGPTDSSP